MPTARYQMNFTFGQDVQDAIQFMADYYDISRPEMLRRIVIEHQAHFFETADRPKKKVVRQFTPPHDVE